MAVVVPLVAVACIAVVAAAVHALAARGRARRAPSRGAHAIETSTLVVEPREDDDLHVYLAAVAREIGDSLPGSSVALRVVDASGRTTIATHGDPQVAGGSPAVPSSFDPVTGLPDRDALLEHLRALLGSGGTAQAAVLVVDLDGFRAANAGLGRHVGDRLLTAAAGWLATALAPGDVVGRVGPDEFLVVAPLDGERAAVAAGERIVRTLARTFHDGDAVVQVTASVGVALAAPGADAQDVVSHAEAALARARSSGGGRSAVFEPDGIDGALDRVAAEQSLRHAIANGELRVHYQPAVDLRTGRTVAVEALVRWQHPERGLLGPAAFIALAEESGLVVPLGEWVLRQACRQAAAWRAAAAGAEDLRVNVNLSARQLQEPRTPAMVAAVLAETGLEPAALCLEITESLLVEDVGATLDVLHLLKGLGVRLAVDDFGTGYSSLRYLKRFPLDVLKVDRSFVERLGQDIEDSAIVAAVVNIARTLGLVVVAEGVEHASQANELRALGCHVAQGFHYARPQDAAAVEALFGRDLRPAPGEAVQLSAPPA